MADQKVMLETARNVLRGNQECDEATLRTLLTARFLLQEETDPFGGSAGGGEGMAIFFIFLWPVYIFKWLSFRQRLRLFTRDVDAVILTLRQEGSLTSIAAGRAADAGATADHNGK